MQKRVLALIVCLLGISYPSYAEISNQENEDEAIEAERAAYLDPELKKQQALAATLKEYETVWLDVSYPEIELAQKTLAITQPSLIAEEQGAILLLHDKEQHADWPQIIRPLRQTLPESGWYTLSMSLPDDTRITFPERGLAAKEFDQVTLNDSLKKNLESGHRSRDDTTSDNKNEQSDDAADSADTAEADVENEETVDSSNADEAVDIDLAAATSVDQNKIPYNVRGVSHIEKAMGYIQSKNFKNIVVIAHRDSVELVLHYIKAHKSELIALGFAFIFIEPKLGEDYLFNLADWLGESFSPPILEIINSGAYQSDQYAKKRKLAMNRIGVKSFRQVFISFSNSKVFNESLSRRIGLWLEKNAPGEKTVLQENAIR